MNPPAPLVSAIVSTYNSSRFLRQRLENLFGQTINSALEVIVVNSGSTENEEEIVQEYIPRRPNLRYIRTENRETIYMAWNRGIRIARGQYITNANADDRLRKDALEVLSDTLNSHSNVALVYGDQLVSTIPNQTFEEVIPVAKAKRPTYTRLGLLSGYIVGAQPMWRASLHHEDDIWFDEEYEVAGDYDFACRVAEKYALLHIGEFVGSYYISKGRTNKEFTDEEGTHAEAAEVQEKYVERYLNSLTEEELEPLKRRVRSYKLLPKYVHIALFRLLLRFRPQVRMLPRSFVSWLDSLLSEREGDIERAIKLCKECLNLPKATLVHRQYRRLTGSQTRT